MNILRKDWDDAINVNLKNYFSLGGSSKAIGLQGTGGKIINIASMLSYCGICAYITSKVV